VLATDLYSDQGKLDKAEAMYERALQGYEEALGPKSTLTSNIANNLNMLYANQGKHKEADAMFLRALVGKEEALRPKHTSTVETVGNLGSLDSSYTNQANCMARRSSQGFAHTIKAAGEIMTTIWKASLQGQCFIAMALFMGRMFCKARRYLGANRV
jgi:tetratricopeptide (TPR) repeat protein